MAFVEAATRAATAAPVNTVNRITDIRSLSMCKLLASSDSSVRVLQHCLGQAPPRVRVFMTVDLTVAGLWTAVIVYSYRKCSPQAI